MNSPAGYSLPEGVTELTGGVVTGGRFVAWSRPDGIFVWAPGAGWRRLEGVPPAFDSLLALPMAIVVISRPPRRLGLWWRDAGPAVWWSPPAGGELARVAGDGRFVVALVDAGSARALVVLEVSEKGWRDVATVPFPRNEDVRHGGDLGSGVEVVTEEGLWTVSPGDGGWEANRSCVWTWDGHAVSQWRRACGRIFAETNGGQMHLVDRATGDRTSMGLRAVEEGTALLEGYLSGNRERLRADLDFLARLPRSWGRRPIRELLLLSGEDGPVAALHPFGVITAESDDLLSIPVWARPSPVFVLDAADLMGWRLAAWPDEALPEAARQVVESTSDDLVCGLFELLGERATGEVIRAVRGGNALDAVHPQGGLSKLVALCGRRADEAARDGLRSEDLNEILVSLAVLRFRGPAPRDEPEPASSGLAERLSELAARPERAIQRDALLTIGATRQEALREVVEERLGDGDEEIRPAAAEALLRLDPERRDAIARVGVVAREDLDPQVRGAVLAHLADVAERGGTSEVVAALRDADSDVRQAAANGVVCLAQALDAGRFLEAADAALEDLIGDVAGAPASSGEPLGLADLPERIENVLAGSTDPPDSRGFVALPHDVRRNRLRAATLRAVIARVFGKALDSGRSVVAANARLVALLEEEPDAGIRGLALSAEEARGLEERAWNRHHLARFCLRIRSADPDLSDRLALLVPLLSRPDADSEDSLEEKPSLAARLRAVGQGRAEVDAVLGRVRAIADAEGGLAPLAALALVKLDGKGPALARARAWVRTGRWRERPSALARFVLLFEKSAARGLLAEVICTSGPPLTARYQVERALSGRGLLEGHATLFLPYLKEVVAFGTLPLAERRAWVRGIEGEARETLRAAYLAARDAEGGRTPDDERLDEAEPGEEDSTPPF